MKTTIVQTNQLLPGLDLRATNYVISDRDRVIAEAKALHPGCKVTARWDGKTRVWRVTVTHTTRYTLKGPDGSFPAV